MRRIIAIILLILAIGILISVPVLAFTPLGTSTRQALGVAEDTPTPLPRPSPTPRPAPTPVLTVKGTPPTLEASEVYLLDSDTGHVLDDVHGTDTRPMASTTKIMTALIALQSGDLYQPVEIHQDAYDRVHVDGGSSAQLVVGDTLTLHDLLYALLIPSGDDAAVAIADALGGTRENFVARMNLFAYRLHLFHTHFANPDGLSLTDAEDQQHYTSAADLLKLTNYAMSIPLFDQIVKLSTYSIPATSSHRPYTWNTTNTLLTTYKGMIGVKTGHTDAAGYCLVFAATRNGHHLLGVIMNSPNQDERDQDVTTLLNWGFSLPVLPPIA